ncbi:MAG TPA: phosphoribosylformimino-5-aminoimidazole carboxamide ribotide isomerase [Chitinispirillaceae bacterium]|nr:phosphoribosylformimino-5-aminoimidazole carboxamide ribotide isomerase [Chitinispirillaceae bacterium]
MRFRPCIDLYQGKVKQIVGSTLSDDGRSVITNFETDIPSSYFAEIYKKENLPGGHVIMLGPGNEASALDALRAYRGGLQVGGGITPRNAFSFLDAGASHVIVTSFVFNDGIVHWDRLSEISRLVGKNRLVLDLSCKWKDGSYYVVTDRWQKYTRVTLGEENFAKLAMYCDEFLIHAADVEGKRAGIDLRLIELLSKECPVTSTYAGGINSLDDLGKIKVHGKSRVDFTIGSALDIFGGSLKLKEVIQWCRNSL